MKIEIKKELDSNIYYRVLNSYRQVLVQKLPVFLGHISNIPSGIDSIVITADLQGRELYHERNLLIGEVVPHQLHDILTFLNIDTNNSIALLAGDFYSRELMDRKGGHGNVVPVWDSFSKYFKYTIGVPGNHDLFQQDAKLYRTFLKNEKIKFLDKSDINLDGMKIGGLGGIIGNPRKPFRKTQIDYLNYLNKLLSNNLDILIMHDGPDVPDIEVEGISKVREIIEDSNCKLIIRGHKHWDNFFHQNKNGNYIINAHEKIIILKAEQV